MNAMAHVETAHVETAHVETAHVETQAALAPAARPAQFRLVIRPEIKAAIGLGVLSGFLYFMLYIFGDDIRRLAELTTQGHRAYFLVPIAIAFVFSLVHGLFTDRFWEAVGLKAKR